MKRTKLNYAPLWSRIVPGDATLYIKHAMHEIKWGDRVVLCIRESNRSQKANAIYQEIRLRRELLKLGAVIVRVVTEIGPGWNIGWLAYPAYLAKRYDAKLVAESTDRFVRHHGFDPKLWPTARARTCDLRAVAVYADGVTMVTLLHPNAVSEEVKTEQTKRGIIERRSQAGRPTKKNKRQEVIRLRERGLSLRQIEKQTTVPKTTIRRWLEAATRTGRANFMQLQGV